MSKDHHEKGQGFLEYALIISLVAVVVIVILYLLGPAVGSTFSNVISII
jgi:pilus assembly protein Flp/PilA